MTSPSTPPLLGTPPAQGSPAASSPATRTAALGSSLARSASLPRNGIQPGPPGSKPASGLARAGSAGASSANLAPKRELTGDKPNEGPQSEVNGHHVDIDKIIQMATSHSPRPPSAQPMHPARSGTPSNSQQTNFQHQQPPMPHQGPGQDTRMCLFVGNLPFRVRWQDVKDLFRRAGTVLRADVSLGSDNRSRGHGTVLMGSREDGIRAVDMFNGYNWQTRVLEVRPDRLPPEFEQHAGPQPPPHLQQHPQQMQYHPQSHPMAQAFTHPGPRSGSPFYNHGPPPPNGFHHGPPPPHPHPLSGPPSTGPQGSSPSLLVPASVLAASALHGTPPAPSSSATLSTPTATTSALPTPPLSTNAPSAHITPTIASSSVASVAGAQLRNSSKSPAEAGHRAPPPPPLGSLPPPPAFGQVGHSMQPAYLQQHQQASVSPSAGPRPNAGGVAGRVLFVGNLPYHIQWQDLKDLFRPAGNIIRADVVLGPDGRSKGIGHVLFATEEDASRGIQKYDGHELNGRVLQVRHEPNVAPSNGPPQQQQRQMPPHQQQQQPHLPQQQQQMYQQQPYHPSAYPMPLPSPHHQPPPMNFPLYGYEPPSPYHPPPSPFYPPPSPFHAPFQPPTYLHQGANGSAKPGEGSSNESRGHHHPGPISLPPAYAGFGGASGSGSPMVGRSGGGGGGVGLPMMTPSMPAFQFGGAFQVPQTPEFYPHAFLSPGLGPLSPDPNSPRHPQSSSSSFSAFHPHPPQPIGQRPILPPLTFGSSSENNNNNNTYNPMFPPSPAAYRSAGGSRQHERMETPGQVYFPGGMGGYGGWGGAPNDHAIEEVGGGGKTPPAGGQATQGKSTGGSVKEGEGYPFPLLGDQQQGQGGQSEGGDGGEVEELREEMETGFKLGGGERSRRNSGGGA